MMLVYVLQMSECRQVQGLLQQMVMLVLDMYCNRYECQLKSKVILMVILKTSGYNYKQAMKLWQ